MPNITDGYVVGVGGYYRVSDNSGPYAISSTGVVTLLTPPMAATVVGPQVTYTDRSGQIGTGGTAQSLMSANANRRGFFVQNQSTTDLFINSLTNANIGQPSLRISAGAIYETPTTAVPTTAVSIIGGTTGQAFACREY